MSKKTSATTPETKTTEPKTTEPKTTEPKTKVYFALSPTQETYFKIFDQPKQVRDICKIIIAAKAITQENLLDAMGEGGIKTRQSPDKILAYYLKVLTHEVGVSLETK